MIYGQFHVETEIVKNVGRNILTWPWKMKLIIDLHEGHKRYGKGCYDQVKIVLVGENNLCKEKIGSYLISRSSNLQIYPALKIGSSGSKCLKMYIRVFSIIANRSGLSDAHFISQTSFLSKRTNSPSFPPFSEKEETFC